MQWNLKIIKSVHVKRFDYHMSGFPIEIKAVCSEHRNLYVGY